MFEGTDRAAKRNVSLCLQNFPVLGKKTTYHPHLNKALSSGKSRFFRI